MSAKNWLITTTCVVVMAAAIALTDTGRAFAGSVTGVYFVSPSTGLPATPTVNVGNLPATQPVSGTIALATGTTVGLASGSTVGLESGATVGLASGATVGLASGATVGLASGATVGLASGATVGLASGATVGLASGTTVSVGNTGANPVPVAVVSSAPTSTQFSLWLQAPPSSIFPTNEPLTGTSLSQFVPVSGSPALPSSCSPPLPASYRVTHVSGQFSVPSDAAVFGVEIYVTDANAPRSFVWHKNQPAQFVAPVKIGSNSFGFDFYQFDATTTLRIDASAGEALFAEVDTTLGPSQVDPQIIAAATVE
jgi:hypothetical protein